ncbi:hypothetical protein GC163_07715 [bacterium]|nr:hypothetical protein [bacterium]
MRDSVAAIVGVIFAASSIIAILNWSMGQPSPEVWTTRIVSTVISAICVIAILFLEFQPDRARDYLRDACGEYFNRDGFAFTVDVICDDDAAYFLFTFQNQYDRPCESRIAISPILRKKPRIQTIERVGVEIVCPPAGFGAAQMPFAVPGRFQGMTLDFEIGCTAMYPEGRGRRVRFHRGVTLDADANFRNLHAELMVLGGLLAGRVPLGTIQPNRMEFLLPIGTFETVPKIARPRMKILWKWGDPPLLADEVRHSNFPSAS